MGLWVCAWIVVILGVVCRVHFKRGNSLGVWRSVGALCAVSLCCAVAACSSVVWQCVAVRCGALRCAAVRCCVWLRGFVLRYSMQLLVAALRCCTIYFFFTLLGTTRRRLQRGPSSSTRPNQDRCDVGTRCVSPAPPIQRPRSDVGL